MTDIVRRLKDADAATHALFDYIFQDAREEIERLRAKIEAMEQQDRIFDAIERTWYKQGLDVRGASLSNFMAEVLSLAPGAKGE